MRAMNSVHSSSIDVTMLRTLDTLLRTESTVVAARELGITQSAVSHALRRLREALGHPLFVVVGRKLVATDRARALAPRVTEALAALERVLTETAAFEPAALSTTFRIVAPDSVELVLLPRLLEALATEAPGVELTTLLTGDTLEDVIQRGEADLALGARFRERAGLVHRALYDDTFACVMRSDHPIRRLTLRAYCDARHVLVSPRGLPGGVVDDRLAEDGRSRRVVLRTPSFQTALALVARTDLLVTLPRSVADAYATTTPLRIVPAPLPLPALRFGMVFAASRRDDPAHRWLRERIAGVLSARSRRRAS